MSYLQQYHRLKANWADFEPTIKYDEIFNQFHLRNEIIAKLRFMYCGQSGKENAVFIEGMIATIYFVNDLLSFKEWKKFTARTLQKAWEKIIEDGKYVYYDEDQEKYITKRVTYIMPRKEKNYTEIILPGKNVGRIEL